MAGSRNQIRPPLRRVAAAIALARISEAALLTLVWALFTGLETWGYWVAQWPDMKGPVRANVTLVGEVLTSDSRFDDRSDPLRYGSTEHAVLKRVSGK